MLLQFKSLSDIMTYIVDKKDQYANMSHAELSEFKLYCEAYEQRTFRPVTFAEFDSIVAVLNATDSEKSAAVKRINDYFRNHKK